MTATEPLPLEPLASPPPKPPKTKAEKPKDAPSAKSMLEEVNDFIRKLQGDKKRARILILSHSSQNIPQPAHAIPGLSHVDQQMVELKFVIARR